MDGKLQAMLHPNDLKLTIEQKHLLNLARAILRKTKILIIDEPLAELDLK
jgi:ABC-type multidrug transport system fused ATPase/permease subunit